MYRVLVTDSLADEGLEVLRRHESIEVVVRPGLEVKALSQALREADGVIIRSATRLTGEVLDGQPRLRAIVRAGVGVDNIDVSAATRRGIVVMNTPAGNTLSTAEHTIALILALSRNISPAHESLRHGRWERNRLTGTQVAGKVLGIVGLGRIGMAVARRALALEMKVLGYDPYLSAERAAEQGVRTLGSLEELLPQCDFLTVHTPLSDETRGMIGRRELALTRPGVRIINCARGGIIDEAALAEFLQSGHVAGAALDVFEVEPPPADHPLLQFPNVLVTPHLAASTAEAQASVAIEAAQLMVDYLTTGAVRYAVNMVPIEQAELAGHRLYLDMAWRLGLLQAQLARSGVRRVHILYRGEAAGKNTRLISAAFAAGLLQPALAQEVNIVNAEVLARERGIEIVEQTSTQVGDFSTLVRTEVITDQGEYVATGTLFGNQFLRLVHLGPFHLDAYLDGILMIFTHRDVPGLIGFIGTIFGKHNVNIAQMTVGREKPVAGGPAIAVLNLDSEPPEEALREVRAHPEIQSVNVVKLPPPSQLPHWLTA